jgi:hypothetical protein
VREDGLQMCWLLTASHYKPEKCIRVFICYATIDQETAIVVLRRQRAVLCLLTPSNVGLCAVVTHRSFELADHVGGEDAGVRWVHVRKSSGREVHRVVRVNAAVWFGFYVHCCSLDEIQVWQEMTLLADRLSDCERSEYLCGHPYGAATATSGRRPSVLPRPNSEKFTGKCRVDLKGCLIIGDNRR